MHVLQYIYISLNVLQSYRVAVTLIVSVVNQCILSDQVGTVKAVDLN